MHLELLAALALTAGSSAAPEGTPVESNLEYRMPIAGKWAYASTDNGSEAIFSNESGSTQLTIRCTRSTRQIRIIKPASTATPSLWVWTSSQMRNLPATYDSAAGQVIANVGGYDMLLDAIASSRGRIGFSTSGIAALVVPPWADVSRVIEDCRV